jgi:hypothetical protein
LGGLGAADLRWAYWFSGFEIPKNQELQAGFSPAADLEKAAILL